MNIYSITALAVGLGMDAMSVCMAVGVKWHGRRQKFRLAWHMGLFQSLTLVLGWAVGSKVAGLLTSLVTYVSAAMVVAVGVRMFFEALRAHHGRIAEQSAARAGRDPSRGWSLMMLSVATSLDALVVGFSLGLRGESIWLTSAVIGGTAVLMALVGVAVGRRIGEAIGRPAEILGAVVLIALGISFVCL